MAHAISSSRTATTANAQKAREGAEAKESGAASSTGPEQAKGASEQTKFEGANAGTEGTSADQKRLEGLQKLVDADVQALAELDAKVQAGGLSPEGLQQAQGHADVLKERLASNTAALNAAKPELPAADKKLEGDLGLKLDLVKQGAPGGKAAAPLKGAKAGQAQGVASSAKADRKAEVFNHRALRLGAEGADVNELTTHLANQKPPLLKEATSTFTAEVKDAVEKFQKKKSLQVDGVVGEQTWGAIHGVSLPPGVSNLRPASAQEIVQHAETKGPVKEAVAGVEAKEAAAAGATAASGEASAAEAKTTDATAAKEAKAEEPSMLDDVMDWFSGLFSSDTKAEAAEPRPTAAAVEQFKGAIQKATVSPEDAKAALALYKENDLLARDYATAFKGGAENLAEAGKDEAAKALGGVGETARTLNTAGAARAAASAHQNLARYMSANAEKILMSDPTFAEATVTGNGVSPDKLADIQDPKLRRLAETELAARTKFDAETIKAYEVAIGIEAGRDGFLDSNEIALLTSLREQTAAK